MTTPNDTTTTTVSDDNHLVAPVEEEEEEEETWDLEKIYTIDEITNSSSKPPTKCMTANCNLLACCQYKSSINPLDVWNTCLDCQENDYGGWPMTKEEIPVTFLSLEHRLIICAKCSVKFDNDDGGGGLDHEKMLISGDGGIMPCNIPTKDPEEGEKEDVCSIMEKDENVSDVPRLESEMKKNDTSTDEETKKIEVEVDPKSSGGNEVVVDTAIEIEKDSKVTATSDADGGEGRTADDQLQSETPNTTVTTPSPPPSAAKETSNDDSPTSVDNKEENNQDANNDGSASPKNDNNDDIDDDDEEEESWDLKHIFTIKELNFKTPTPCMTPGCPLIACSTYISNKSEVWNSCLDCQEKDYGGWPTTQDEIPIKFMTEEHREVIGEKCTGRYSPDMPNLPTSLLQGDDDGSPKSDTTTTMTEVSSPSPPSKSTAVTPPPNGNLKSSNNNKNDNKKNNKGGGSSKVGVTPSPVPPPKKNKPCSKQQQPQPSKQALAIHKKWQDAAKALGGERIVVSKPDAKKMIVDMLTDGFRPMNITEIYKKLKGTIPSPVLKSCLDDMALDGSDGNPFDESDDDDDDDDEDTKRPTKKKKSSSNTNNNDEFAGALCIKTGRNTNTTLYYVDYTKTLNNGDGMLPDDRNALLGQQQEAQAELETQNGTLKAMGVDTMKLLSEPTNIESDLKLEEVSQIVDSLRGELEEARELEGNEKERQKLEKRKETMTAHWRKRKRYCIDFLLLMEESTEGTVSMKKCLSGDGQIDIDSDEAVIKGAMEYGKRMKERKRRVSSSSSSSSRKRARIGNNNKTNENQLTPDENFIGVELDVYNVKRVYLDNDEE